MARYSSAFRLWFKLLVVATSLVAVGFVIRFRLSTDDAAALRVLEANGFTDVRFTGWKPFVCGQDDFVASGFDATGPTGIRVSGAVCGGVMKGYTIRF